MNPNKQTLYAVDDMHGLYVDAFVLNRETGALIFGSFWGRDTAVQELLAKLSLPLSEGGIDQVKLADYDNPAVERIKFQIGNPARLEKLNGRMPEANLFGKVIQVWIFDKSTREPDYPGRRALRLLLADAGVPGKDQRNGAFASSAAWALLKEVSHLPLLDEWRDAIVGEAVRRDWIKFHQGVGVNALEIDLSSPDFEPAVTGLIRAGHLHLPGEAAVPASTDGSGHEEVQGVKREGERLTAAELDNRLAHFHGTETWFRHAIVPSMLYTEGVQFFSEQGGNHGAYWFLDIVATEYFPMLAKQPFQVIELSVKGRKATITVEDGNGRTLKEKEIEYTDMQEGLWRFYLTDNVLLLPGEY